MDVGERVLGWLVSRRAGIVSDGDWDGILASALIVRELARRGYRPGVEFPPPSRIPGMEIGGVLLVELSPTRGYRVVDDALLVDHHGFVGVKLLRPGGEEVWAEMGEADSVAELVARLLGLRLEGDWGRLLHAVNLIDTGRSGEDRLALTLHRAYLYNVSSPEMRRMLLELLVEGRLGEVFKWAEEEAGKYEKALGLVDVITGRARVLGGCAVAEYVLGGDEEKVYREAMFRLEERHGCCVMLAVRDGRVEKMHIGSFREDVDASRIAARIVEALKAVGVEARGGGRRQAAGVQLLSPMEATEAVEVLARVLGGR